MKDSSTEIEDAKTEVQEQTLEQLAYVDCLNHIAEVRDNMMVMIEDLSRRAREHDKSKLEEPEKEIFAKYTHLLKETEYGSPEYEELLVKIKPALEHHYANNSHHTEYHKNGINDMNLMELCEMIADWVAATKRNKSGNIRRSIEINAKKYSIDAQLENILLNTVKKFF